MLSLPFLVFQTGASPDLRLDFLDLRFDPAIARFEQSRPGVNDPLLLRGMKTQGGEIALRESEVRLGNQEINGRPGTLNTLFSRVYPDTQRHTHARVLLLSQNLLIPLLHDGGRIILPRLGAARCIDSRTATLPPGSDAHFLPLFDRAGSATHASAHARLRRLQDLTGEIDLLRRDSDLPASGQISLFPQQ